MACQGSGGRFGAPCHAVPGITGSGIARWHPSCAATGTCDAEAWRWVIDSDMSDAALVQQVLNGDADAFTRLVDRYYERCGRFAVRMLGNRDDAEDALQATFLRAYRSLGRYQERDRFSAWLYRILVNQCRSIASRRSHRERVFIR